MVRTVEKLPAAPGNGRAAQGPSGPGRAPGPVGAKMVRQAMDQLDENNKELNKTGAC